MSAQTQTHHRDSHTVRLYWSVNSGLDVCINFVFCDIDVKDTDEVICVWVCVCLFVCVCVCLCVWLCRKCRQRTTRATFDTLGNFFFSILLLPAPAGIVVLSTYNCSSSCNIKTVLRLLFPFLLHISLAAFCTAPMTRPLWNLYITQETVCPTLLSSASSLPPSSSFLLPLPSLWLQSLIETPLLLPQFLFPFLLIFLHSHPASACVPHNILFIPPLK